MSDHGKVTFILGGARSGKSLHAEKLVTQIPAPWHYIATAQAYDDEMRQRISAHQQRREGQWHTHNVPLDVADLLESLPGDAPILLDCLTLWLTNVMLGERDIIDEINALCAAVKVVKAPLFIVSNEVGLGIVPDNALARQFRDEAGRLNQRIAAEADHVLFMVSGLPMKVK